MKVRVWKHLLKKSEIKTSQAKIEMKKAVEQLRRTEDRLAHLNQIRIEYQGRLKNMENINHSMEKNLMYRKFIGQVSTLEERLVRDLSATKAWVKNSQSKFKEAMRKQAKYEFIIEQHAIKAKRLDKKNETRDAEAAGISRHNLKSSNSFFA